MPLASQTTVSNKPSQVSCSAGAQPHACSSIRRPRAPHPDPDKWLCNCQEEHPCLLDLGLLHQPRECMPAGFQSSSFSHQLQLCVLTCPPTATMCSTSTSHGHVFFNQAHCALCVLLLLPRSLRMRCVPWWSMSSQARTGRNVCGVCRAQRRWVKPRWCRSTLPPAGCGSPMAYCSCECAGWLPACHAAVPAFCTPDCVEQLVSCSDCFHPAVTT